MIDETVCSWIIQRIDIAEGGIADVGDGQGVTYFGQTGGWLEQWKLPRPYTVPEANANWRAWMNLTRFDELTGIDRWVAWAVIDHAVNAGESGAVRILQRLLYAAPDGVLGPATISALHTADAARIFRQFCIQRLRFYGATVKSSPEKVKYLMGWLNRVLTMLEDYDGVASALTPPR